MSAQPTPDQIGELVTRFYAKVRTDDVLGPVFNAAVADWDEHLSKLTAFWMSVMLGARSYKGNPMAAHAGHGITPLMFDRWLALWQETTSDVLPAPLAERFIERATLIAKSLKLGLFYRPAS